MGWVCLSLRRNELQASVQQRQFELMQLSRQMRQLSSFANMVGDGQITPTEIGSIGSELFGDAMDFMGYSNAAAMEAAQLQTDYYATAYGDVTSNQYYNNPSLAAQASLYFDESGALNTDMMYQEFYEQALEDYAQTYIMPKLNELEKDMQNEKTELETLLESEQAELESVKESISQQIQSSTIKL